MKGVIGTGTQAYHCKPPKSDMFERINRGSKIRTSVGCKDMGRRIVSPAAVAKTFKIDTK
jgi:hypothetical protein